MQLPKLLLHIQGQNVLCKKVLINVYNNFVQNIFWKYLKTKDFVISLNTQDCNFIILNWTCTLKTYSHFCMYFKNICSFSYDHFKMIILKWPRISAFSRRWLLTRYIFEDVLIKAQRSSVIKAGGVRTCFHNFTSFPQFQRF